MKILIEIGNIYRNYIVVYLFKVIWVMYSSDIMKTVIICFKDYNKNIVLRDCQTNYFQYLFEKKGDPFDFLPSFCWTPCQNIYMINRYWTSFETLAVIERETAENDNSAWKIGGLAVLVPVCYTPCLQKWYIK